MDHFIHPTSSSDNRHFKRVLYPLWMKYTHMKNNFKIIKNKNSQYERLTESNKRGKPASIELLNKLLKDCELEISSAHLALLYQIQNIKLIDHKEEIYFLVARENMFKEYLHSDTQMEGYEKYFKIVAGEMANNQAEKEVKLESILTLLGAMDLNREEIIKIIHFLARV